MTRTETVLLFDSSSWTSNDLLLNFLLKELLGQADVSNSANSRGLLATKLYNNSKLIYAVEAFNMHFSDAGLFGV